MDHSKADGSPLNVFCVATHLAALVTTRFYNVNFEHLTIIIIIFNILLELKSIFISNFAHQ